MKAFLLIPLFWILSFEGFSQKNVETRNISEFTRLKVSGNIHVDLVKGDKSMVTIKTNDALTTSDVLTKVKNNELRLSLKTKIYKKAEVHVIINYSNLQSIHAGSSSRVKTKEPLSSESLEISTSSAGKLFLNVDVKFLNSSSGTGGETQVKGKAQQIEAMASSGGTFDGYDLEAQKAYVKANTGGVIEVNVSEFMEAKAATGGSVHYSGNPKKVSIKENLGGKIEIRK